MLTARVVEALVCQCLGVELAHGIDDAACVGRRSRHVSVNSTGEHVPESREVVKQVMEVKTKTRSQSNHQLKVETLKDVMPIAGDILRAPSSIAINQSDSNFDINSTFTNMSARTDVEAEQMQNSSGVTPQSLEATLREKLEASHVEIVDMSGTCVEESGMTGTRAYAERYA